MVDWIETQSEHMSYEGDNAEITVCSFARRAGLD